MKSCNENIRVYSTFLNETIVENRYQEKCHIAEALVNLKQEKCHIAEGLVNIKHSTLVA